MKEVKEVGEAVVAVAGSCSYLQWVASVEAGEGTRAYVWKRKGGRVVRGLKIRW